MSQQNPKPGSEIILYQSEDGRTRLQVKLENKNVWLSQAQMAELFQVTLPTVNEHLKGIFAERELPSEGTIRKYRIVRQEGSREVSREIEHYSLEAILAVGYRVRSHRGTQFRQWATARLSEYLVKGFTRSKTLRAEKGLNRNRRKPPWLMRHVASGESGDTSPQSKALRA